MLADGSMTAYPVPRPLSKEEIQSIVQDYATAAHNATEIAGVILPQLLFQTPQGHDPLHVADDIQDVSGLLTHA